MTKETIKEINNDYVNSEFDKMVSTGNMYQIQVYDEYGNKTKYLNITREQKDKIQDILML